MNRDDLLNDLLDTLADRVASRLDHSPVKAWTVPDAAEHLGLSPDQVRRLIRDGKLPALKAGKEYRLSPRAVEAALGGGQAA